LVLPMSIRTNGARPLRKRCAHFRNVSRHGSYKTLTLAMVDGKKRNDRKKGGVVSTPPSLNYISDR
jgi:hypothetical protein